MHVEEAEDFGFGEAECVEHEAGFQVHALAKVHHHLHADGPFPLVMARGQAEMRVQLPAYRAHRPIAHHGQGRLYVHAGHKAGFGIARRSLPWSTSLTPVTAPSSISALATGVPGQICAAPVAISWFPTHWLNCPTESTSPPFL